MAASRQDGLYDALVLFVGQEMIEIWLARCGLMYVQPRSGDKNESQDRSDFHEFFSNMQIKAIHDSVLARRFV